MACFSFCSFVLPYETITSHSSNQEQGEFYIHLNQNKLGIFFSFNAKGRVSEVFIILFLQRN